jgi:uncharacterized protein YodC (DUF2158 family)
MGSIEKCQAYARGGDPLNPGDVVALRSGGPLMTVSSVVVYPETPANVKVVWFDDTGELCQCAFPEILLTTDDEEMLDVH